MSAGRFFVDPSVLADPAHVELPLLIANQARSVLRLNVGDHLTLLDNTGMTYDVELIQVSAKHVIGRVVAQAPVTTEPHAQVILYQGLLKAAKFEWIVQKGTEIGLSAIVPVQCRRSVLGADDVSASKLSRWRSIATEAAEQADRGRVPAVREPMLLADALMSLPSGEDKVLAFEGETYQTIRAALLPVGVIKPVHLFIGPEGGFELGEIALAREYGVKIVTLGPRILRAETAALVAATLVLDAVGEMQ